VTSWLKVEVKNMDRFSKYFDENDTPVCRFGPGGDFVQDWPLRPRSRQTDPISKILETIAKIIGTVITPQLLQRSNADKISIALTDIEQAGNMEDKIDFNQSDKSDTKTDASAQTDRKLPQEPMLFDNNTGAGAIAGHKQNNGFRAHRRTKRKRVSFRTIRQGSLFEPYPESSKVA
jgi:hypothetical protein